MDKETIGQLLKQGQRDQMETAAKDLAYVVGAYHDALKHQRIAGVLIETLVVEYQRLLLRRVLWPDAPAAPEREAD